MIRNYLDATWFSMLFDFDAIIRCLQNAHKHTRAFMIHLDRHGWQIPGIEASNNSVHYHQVLIWFCSSSLGLIPCMSSGGSARHIVDRLPPPPPTCTVLLVLQLHVSTVQKLRFTKGYSTTQVSHNHTQGRPDKLSIELGKGGQSCCC